MKDIYDSPRGPNARQVRQENAAEMEANRPQRTPQERLQVLDKRLGEGAGAKKERARLQAQIQENENVA